MEHVDLSNRRVSLSDSQDSLSFEMNPLDRETQVGANALNNVPVLSAQPITNHVVNKIDKNMQIQAFLEVSKQNTTNIEEFKKEITDLKIRRMFNILFAIGSVVIITPIAVCLCPPLVAVITFFIGNATSFYFVDPALQQTEEIEQKEENKKKGKGSVAYLGKAINYLNDSFNTKKFAIALDKCQGTYQNGVKIYKPDDLFDCIYNFERKQRAKKRNRRAANLGL